MVQRGAGDNAILVDLVSYDTDFEAFKFFGTIADQRDDIFPNSTHVISRYDEAPYVVHFEDEQTWKDNNLEYRKLCLIYKSEPAHTIHYFYYTAWPNSQGIDPDKLEFMLEQVNEKFTNQKIIGNCLWGKGRTGTWFEAWAIYQATVVAKSTEWFFSSPDPIKDYTVKIHHQRNNMIDSANQYVYLYQKWARRMWDRVSEKA
ncbi:hypothetical protein NUU61_010153 [Penicillium alfredii]|uniref:Tyrosine specific protein phosphatases domain-containing protein n=1 Tax=Penicillium alfredii TaxID=1506179 RepID=A0A9W9EHG5_9EURO|nr:uncharacterized protein NUU61_010153 [Penicillium alfredii]KAJ5081889.1 hypothetical protein NUU61_010153 [Penicillium alfredii]